MPTEGEPTVAPTGGGVVTASRAVPVAGIEGFRAPTIGIPRLQLPSVPSTRPVADAIGSGFAAAIGMALLAYFGLLTRTPHPFGSRPSHRIAPRGPPQPAVARP